MSELACVRELEFALQTTASELGYKPTADPFLGEERSDLSWTFNRTGQFFMNEIISCLGRVSPLEVVVHFIGSDYSSSDLHLRGVFSSAVMTNLFDFQFYKLGIPFTELLPKVIAIDNDSSSVSRLQLELKRTDCHVWADLLRRASVSSSS